MQPKYALRPIAALLLCCAAPASADDVLTLNNAYKHEEGLYTTGQPDETQFWVLADAGVQVVINLAPADLPASLGNERELVESEGMAYHFIPVGWQDPKIDSVRRFFAAMDAHRGETVLVHCWLNSRASAFVYLYRTVREARPETDERRVLEAIWSNNEGYELANVPHWRRFLKDASAALK